VPPCFDKLKTGSNKRQQIRLVSPYFPQSTNARLSLLSQRSHSLSCISAKTTVSPITCTHFLTTVFPSVNAHVKPRCFHQSTLMSNHGSFGVSRRNCFSHQTTVLSVLRDASHSTLRYRHTIRLATTSRSIVSRSRERTIYTQDSYRWNLQEKN